MQRLYATIRRSLFHTREGERSDTRNIYTDYYLGFYTIGYRTSRMAVSDAWLIAIGLLGLTLAYALLGSSEQVFEFGALRFNPYLAAISGFGFLVVWGVLSVFGLTSPILEALGSPE